MIDKGNRPATARVLRPRSIIVFLFPRFQIDTRSTVERIVTAPSEVNEVGHGRKWWVGRDLNPRPMP